MTTVLGLGEQAADAIRELNHHTRHADAFDDPSELCWLLADLNATAQRLPQLFGQLSRWLANEHLNAALKADANLSTDQITTAAITALTDAARHAHQVAAAVDTAHQHAAHLAAT